jgi:hypothetical protein
MEQNKNSEQGADSMEASDRKSEATSSETLGDLQQAQKIPAGTGTTSGTNDSSGGNSGSSPSLSSGDLSTGGGRADGSDTGGPM